MRRPPALYTKAAVSQPGTRSDPVAGVGAHGDLADGRPGHPSHLAAHVGRLVLDRNVTDFHTEMEQAAFEPNNQDCPAFPITELEPNPFS